MTQTFFNGTLSIDWSPYVGHKCELSVGDWESGLAVVAHTQDGSNALSLIDVGDWIFSIDDPAINRWRDTLPTPINDGLSCLPSQQASILRWAVDSKAIVDLLISNPLLLWLLVDNGLLGRASPGEINQKLKLKQKQLCEGLGLSGTEQQVRILRRAAISNLPVKLIRDLRVILKSDAVCDFLGHRREIPGPVIDTLRRFPWLVRYPARALVDSLEDPETLRFFQDVIRMLDDLGPLYQCRSARAVVRLHDRLVEHINRDDGFSYFRDDYGDIKELPSPPIPGNDTIQPLTSQQQIVAEGREMRHCIASYIGSVVKGEYYVYQMLEPERLTIGVAVGVGRAKGQWQQCFLREVRGKCNHHPADLSRRLIEDWFDDATSQSAALKKNL